MLRLLRYNEKAYCKRTYNVFGRLRGLDAAENGPIQGAKVFYKKKNPNNGHTAILYRAPAKPVTQAEEQRFGDTLAALKRQDVIK